MKVVPGIVTSALLLSGVLAFAQQQQPSLGEVARQPKPTRKATRVITDDDMPSRPKTPDAKPEPSSIAPRSEAKPSAESADAKETSKSANSEKADSAEVAGLKERLKALEGDQQNLASGIADLEKSAVSEPDPARREVFLHMAERKRDSLNKSKAEHSAINRMIDEQKKSEEK